MYCIVYIVQLCGSFLSSGALFAKASGNGEFEEGEDSWNGDCVDVRGYPRNPTETTPISPLWTMMFVDQCLQAFVGVNLRQYPTCRFPMGQHQSGGSYDHSATSLRRPRTTIQQHRTVMRRRFRRISRISPYVMMSFVRLGNRERRGEFAVDIVVVIE